MKSQSWAVFFLTAASAMAIWLLPDFLERRWAAGFSIEPLRRQAGQVRTGSITTVVFRAINHSPRAVRVVGLGTC